MPDVPYTLQWAADVPPKLPLPLGDPGSTGAASVVSHFESKLSAMLFLKTTSWDRRKNRPETGACMLSARCGQQAAKCITVTDYLGTSVL